MKTKIDKSTCIGCGACSAICPLVFQMNYDTNKAEVVSGQEDSDDPAVQDSITACPTGSIIIEN